VSAPLKRRIRKAAEADLDVVRSITADAYLPYEATIGVVPIPALEDYRPRIARGEVWLLEGDDGIAGLIVLEEKLDHVLIYSVAVRPDLHGRGHGRRLLNFADQRAREIGMAEVRLYTNQRMVRNIEIYERSGFAVTGTRAHPTRAGHVVVDMAKRINPPTTIPD
jgi:ribosomal protein S18 acetylase RimI-like enzyme